MIPEKKSSIYTKSRGEMDKEYEEKRGKKKRNDNKTTKSSK